MSLWQRIKDWFSGLEPCYKESIGYNCHHRTNADGSKECGEFPNYWRGNDE